MAPCGLEGRATHLESSSGGYIDMLTKLLRDKILSCPLQKGSILWHRYIEMDMAIMKR